MASFVYWKYIQKSVAGAYAVAPSAWGAFYLALVTGAYSPNQATDSVLGDIPGGAIAADGKTGTFPVLTLVALVPTTPAANDVAGIKLSLAAAPNNVWGAVPAGAAVTRAILYGAEVVGVGPYNLVAAYDDWAGLPFTPDGTDVPLVSLPTPLAAGGDNMIRVSTP